MNALLLAYIRLSAYMRIYSPGTYEDTQSQEFNEGIDSFVVSAVKYSGS